MWNYCPMCGSQGGASNPPSTSSTRPLASKKPTRQRRAAPKKPRAKSAWQTYIGQKKNQVRYKSGSKKGMLNLKAMARAYRKKKR